MGTADALMGTIFFSFGIEPSFMSVIGSNRVTGSHPLNLLVTYHAVQNH
jgi:hypothetical protein